MSAFPESGRSVYDIEIDRFRLLRDIRLDSSEGLLVTQTGR
jgi:hypothetical protein